MGQISDVNRAGRFIKEFGPDLDRVMEIDKPEVISQLISHWRGAGDGRVTHGIVVKCKLGREHFYVEGENVIFDPSSTYDDEEEQELVEYLSELLQEHESTIRDRLRKADLIDE